MLIRILLPQIRRSGCPLSRCRSPSIRPMPTAKAIHDCAVRLHAFPLPSEMACRITLFAAAYVPPPDDIAVINPVIFAPDDTVIRPAEIVTMPDDTVTIINENN